MKARRLINVPGASGYAACMASLDLSRANACIHFDHNVSIEPRIWTLVINRREVVLKLTDFDKAVIYSAVTWTSIDQ